jgi:uncharacterized membrane protein YeaQ/YmgE (transglycosylase-associated protein family)
MSEHEEASRRHSQPTNDGSEDNISTKTKSVAELALLYIGIPGATLYPLGLVALLIQLLRDPHFPYYDPVTAWSAVSVIPQTVVIGTGISLAYTSLFAALVGLEVYYLTLLLLRHWQKRKNAGSGSENSSTRRERRRVLRWSLYLLPLLPLAILQSISEVNFDQPGHIIVLVGFIVFACGGGALAGYLRERRYHGGSYSSFVVAYIGALLAALCLSALSDPALPQVEIETAQVGAPLDCSEASDKDRFVMLSQSGPYWYVYNKGGLFAFTMDTAHHLRFRDTLNSRYGETIIPECPEEEGVNEFLQMVDGEEE